MDSTEHNIKASIVRELSTFSEGKFVTRILMGLRYTAVQLDDGSMGVAFTFLDDEFKNGLFFGGRAGPSGRPAVELLRMLESHNQLDRAVGLAAANALAAGLDNKYLDGDVLRQMKLYETDKVCMVGRFQPLDPKIRPNCADLKIFEIEEDLSEGILPFSAAGNHLPEADIVIVTATAIVNDTIDEVLSYCRKSREVVVLGASTPLLPEVFRKTPVTLLSGIEITGSNYILQVIGEGGGTQRFKPGVQKVNLRVE